jgi:hypothetical protein
VKYSFLFVFVLLISPPCRTQTAATGQASTNAPCSVANSGSDNKIRIECGIGKEQGEAILKILNRILEKELDLNVVVAKLDEIQKEVHRIDPSGPVVSYATNGYKRVVRSGQINMMLDDNLPTYKVFQKMESANANRDWQSLASLSDQAIKETPEWLTPYEFRVMAYVNLGKMTGNEAVSVLEDLKAKIADNHDYADLAVLVDGVLRQLHSKGY